MQPPPAGGRWPRPPLRPDAAPFVIQPGAKAARGNNGAAFTLFDGGTVVNEQDAGAIKNLRWPSQEKVITRIVRSTSQRWTVSTVALPVRATGTLLGCQLRLTAPAKPTPPRPEYDYEIVVPSGLNLSYVGEGGAVADGTAGIEVAISAQGEGVTSGTGSPYSVSYGAQGGATTSGGVAVGVSILGGGGVVTTGTGSPYSVSYAGSGGAATSGTAGVALSIRGTGGAVATGTGSPYSVAYTGAGGATTSGSAAVGVSILGRGGAVATGTGSPYSVAYTGSGGASTSGTAGVSLSVIGQGGVVATGTGSPLDVSYVASGGAATTGGAALGVGIIGAGGAVTGGAAGVVVVIGTHGRRPSGSGGGGPPVRYLPEEEPEKKTVVAVVGQETSLPELLRIRIRELEETVVALRDRTDKAAHRKIAWLEAQVIVLAEKLAAQQAVMVPTQQPSVLAGVVDRLAEARKAALAAAVTGGVTYALVPPSWPVTKKVGYSIASSFAMKAFSIWIEEWLAAQRVNR